MTHTPAPCGGGAGQLPASSRLLEEEQSSGRDQETPLSCGGAGLRGDQGGPGGTGDHVPPGPPPQDPRLAPPTLHPGGPPHRGSGGRAARARAPRTRGEASQQTRGRGAGRGAADSGGRRTFKNRFGKNDINLHHCISSSSSVSASGIMDALISLLPDTVHLHVPWNSIQLD
jgi:hypothetical protein